MTTPLPTYDEFKATLDRLERTAYNSGFFWGLVSGLIFGVAISLWLLP